MASQPEDSAVLDDSAVPSPPPPPPTAAPKSKGGAARPPKPPAAPTPPTDSAEEEEPAEEPAGIQQRILSESPSWLLSLVLHIAVLLVFALWYLPSLPDAANALLFEPGETEIDDFEDIPEMSLDPSEVEEMVEFEVQPVTENVAEVVDFSEFNELTEAPSLSLMPTVTDASLAATEMSDLDGFDGTGTTGRGQAARTQMVRTKGGSAASEEAVALALSWLAEHQNPDGTWSLIHNRHKCDGRCGDPATVRLTGGQTDEYIASLKSGTGLALLPFLGAGQTHKQGRYRRVVDKGLRALVALGELEKDRPGVSWREGTGSAQGNMYAHGIAAIALTEAYGMTGDSSLRAPAQAAINYIVHCQGPGGGWRYIPKQAGDTSVTGWQIMALKSGYLADLTVPTPTIKDAVKFLDSVQNSDGSEYSYAMGGDGALSAPNATISAVGLLCRMYTGWDHKKPALVTGVAKLARRGPSRNNYYYNYYAAQVLFQHTGGSGRMWREWNRKMRDQLIEQQEKTGHAKGSWYLKGPHNERGGRIYMTSLATMSLEIYYRYMPIYGSSAVEGEF